VNSRLYPVLFVAALALGVGLAVNATAQTRLDTTYATVGARPFDVPINPDRYLIRPGERLEVTFIDLNLPSLVLTVNPEGQVAHSGLGAVQLSGLTLTEARKLLIDALKSLYNAKEVIVSIGSIYPVPIQVLGMVNHPGIYIGYTSERVRDIIDSAGGIAPGGSSRRILLRGGPKDLQADLDLTTYTENTGFNPYLYGGRKVFVPELSDAPVTVTGEVVKPRDIELLPGETLSDLITLAGGIKVGADTAAAFAVNEPTRNIRLAGGIRPGDQIMVPSSSHANHEGRVVIVGAVKTSCLRIPIEGSVTVGDLITRAGGLTSEANEDRIAVFRLVQYESFDNGPLRRFPIWVTPGSQTTFQLKASDSVYVPTRLGFVEISGAVSKPGMYPFSESLKVADCLTMAGGQVPGIGNTLLEITDRVTGITRTVAGTTPVSDGDRVTVKTVVGGL
jgi:protein involved in polysaccharide export with SLBB domain